MEERNDNRRTRIEGMIQQKGTNHRKVGKEEGGKQKLVDPENENKCQSS